MRSPSSLKQEFLKKWLKGLKTYSLRKKDMSTIERKNAIKLSADIAMASTRISTSSWSHALVAKVSNDPANKILVEHVLGPQSKTLILKKDPKKSIMSKSSSSSSSKRITSKNILRKSCTARRMRKKAAHLVEASSIAKRVIMKRTQVLKSLVPGGEYMDEISLIKETLDYVLSLRLQVDVMRLLANATEKMDHM